MRRRRANWAAAWTATTWLAMRAPAAIAAPPELQPEPVGTVATLPETPAPHWFWLSDVLLHRTALFDGDRGELLGTINAGTAGVGFVILPHRAPARRELYIAETYFSRGVRGERTDVVSVYDARTLQPTAEIPIPAKRAEYFPGNASSTLSDDGRFLAIFNLTPAASLSIVDLEARQFVGEIGLPGCALAFAAGPRRFFALCANGEALVATIDDGGHERSVERTAAFFDGAQDPLTEKAVRRGNQWLFVSYAGVVHPVDVGGDALAFGETWPLFTDADRQANWRLGGAQHLAVHAATGRLYALVHQGGPDTHKDPGTEVWVYDVATKQRVQRIAVANPLESFIGLQAGLAAGGWSRWALAKFVSNPGVDRIFVTQDEHPLLVMSAALPPALTVYDALSGAVVREVSEPGLAGSLLAAP